MLAATTIHKVFHVYYLIYSSLWLSHVAVTLLSLADEGMWPWEVRWCSKGHTAGRWQSWSLETRFPASLDSSLPTAAQQLPGQEHAQAHSCTHPHCSMSFLAKPLCFWCWCCPPGRCLCGCLHPRPPPACLKFTGSKKRTTATACGTPAGMAFLLEISRQLYLLWNRGGVRWGGVYPFPQSPLETQIGHISAPSPPSGPRNRADARSRCSCPLSWPGERPRKLWGKCWKKTGLPFS